MANRADGQDRSCNQREASTREFVAVAERKENGQSQRFLLEKAQIEHYIHNVVPLSAHGATGSDGSIPSLQRKIPVTCIRNWPKSKLAGETRLPNRRRSPCKSITSKSEQLRRRSGIPG